MNTSRFDKLIGRQYEKSLLTRSWNDDGVNIVTLVAWGGVGKTSLVVDWLADLLTSDWEGVEAFFDWSFYSQGTQDQSTTSSGLFLDSALRHFGESDIADSSRSAEDKAEQLARCVAERRTLLVLDGVEPLQHPRRPRQMEGRFKDPGIERLLKRLAQATRMCGLCVVTTREPIVDLKRFHGATVREHILGHLSVRHAAQLLHHAGARHAGQGAIDPDDRELVAAARECQGHALTLQLLGGYLKHAHGGDIRRRDRVEWARAAEHEQEGHAWMVMAAYEKWFEQHGETGRQQIASLRLMGLFDRPADAGCLEALRGEPISGLTDQLAELADAQWQAMLSKLEEHRLLTVIREGGRITALDAHPLIREYFACQLRNERDVAWKSGHRRLYEYLTKTTEHRPDTLAGLQPLYQAVAHGCKAALHHNALHNVYIDRILRHTGAGGFYSTQKLGAIAENLSAISSFFDHGWSTLSPNLSDNAKEWVLCESAVMLCALGRLNEALESAQASWAILVPKKSNVPRDLRTEIAKRAGNISELQRLLGQVSAAIYSAEQSVARADQGDSRFIQVGASAWLASALHLAGRRQEAQQRFAEAERLQIEAQPDYPLLYSGPGFRYCDLLLAPAELAAWRHMPAYDMNTQDTRSSMDKSPGTDSALVRLCSDIIERASRTLDWSKSLKMLREIGLDHITLARAVLYRALLEEYRFTDFGSLSKPESEFQRHAMSGVEAIQQSGMIDLLPNGLLTRAWARFLSRDESGSRADLEVAEEIAERGPMPLYLADVFLFRARLFRDHAELDKARRLLEELREKGYHRRDEELVDAVEAARQW